MTISRPIEAMATDGAMSEDPTPRSPRPDELVAVTRDLDVDVDLIRLGAAGDGVLWLDEETGLAGTGVALRLDHRGSAAAVSSALQAIECDDPLALPGTGPVAFAALPFVPGAGGTLVVPRRIVGHRTGRWFETVVALRPSITGAWAEAWTAGPSGSGGPAAGATGAVPATTPPDEFSLTPSMSHVRWQQIIADAVETIRAGDLDKVVLARRVDVTANRPFLAADVLSRLAALYPACMIFHVAGFIGATPELLVRREGDRFTSHPLAGTVARSGDRTADDKLIAGLLASVKDRWEHRIVIEQLARALAPWCETLAVPETPSVLGLRNVSHLATLITGRLAQRDGRLPSALDLVDAIHPTAAVGGRPTAAAVAYLQRVEGFDRGTYAGPVGWVDARGDGAWALGIRSAQLDGHRARIYAGVGVVADSDPAAELAETQLKLQALLAALVRP